MKLLTKKALLVLAVLGSLTACTDYTQSLPDSLPEHTYEGTILDYLKNPDSKDVKFDSLLRIIDEIPEIKNELNAPGKNMTLFVPTDESVRDAISTLNNYRKSNKIGSPVYLSDIMIEPFSVQDTSIVYNRFTLESDTTYSQRKFDYMAQLDSLVSKYCFAEALTSDYVEAAGGSIRANAMRFGMDMAVEAGRYDASGISGAGNKFLYLIELNGSNLQASWTYSEVTGMDIKASNGTIHILSTNHQFGFNQFTSKFSQRGTEKGVCVKL